MPVGVAVHVSQRPGVLAVDAEPVPAAGRRVPGDPAARRDRRRARRVVKSGSTRYAGGVPEPSGEHCRRPSVQKPLAGALPLRARSVKSMPVRARRPGARWPSRPRSPVRTSRFATLLRDREPHRGAVRRAAVAPLRERAAADAARPHGQTRPLAWQASGSAKRRRARSNAHRRAARAGPGRSAPDGIAAGVPGGTTPGARCRAAPAGRRRCPAAGRAVGGRLAPRPSPGSRGDGSDREQRRSVRMCQLLCSSHSGAAPTGWSLTVGRESRVRRSPAAGAAVRSTWRPYSAS